MSVVSTREELKAKLAELGIAIVSEEKHDAVMTCEAQVERVREGRDAKWAGLGRVLSFFSMSAED
eukprot:1070539-Amorphochlora_amoeboformis.AAC.2